ncbi:MAG: YHS domain-containing protein [Gemmatimonadota bacterium]|nr:MAG: YHS domain-containing protein [Gemmatimonadota bacterium]
MKKSEAPVSYTLYFASEEAKEAFLKDPGKYLTTTCPVMGGESNKLTASYSVYKGSAYHFCCPACKEKFEKEPEKYIEKTSKEPEQHDQ